MAATRAASTRLQLRRSAPCPTCSPQRHRHQLLAGAPLGAEGDVGTARPSPCSSSAPPACWPMPSGAIGAARRWIAAEARGRCCSALAADAASPSKSWAATPGPLWVWILDASSAPHDIADSARRRRLVPRVALQLGLGVARQREQQNAAAVERAAVHQHLCLPCTEGWSAEGAAMGECASVARVAPRSMSRLCSRAVALLLAPWSC